MKTDPEPAKRSSLFRTHTTELTEDELLILDVMFECSVTYPMLRTCNFVPQFNARSHSLDDEKLKSTLDDFRQRGITTVDDQMLQGQHYISITATGGELWAAERRPKWERYCTESYPATIRGRTIMSVKCTTSWVRDDFLRLWPEYPARTRKATIKDFGLVHWRDFGKLHIGLANYAEPVRRTPDEYFEWMPRHQEHIEQVERERSWWRTVRELQKFIEPQLVYDLQTLDDGSHVQILESRQNKGLQTKPSIRRFDLRRVYCLGSLSPDVLSNNSDTYRSPNVIENSDVAIRTGITLARVAQVCTVASSTSLTIVIAATWAAAWRTGAIPGVEAWQYYRDTGNGPWNHNGEMTAYVDFVFLASAMTLASGIAMAVLVRPVGQRWLGGFAIVFAVATMWYHFLLID